MDKLIFFTLIKIQLPIFQKHTKLLRSVRIGSKGINPVKRIQGFQNVEILKMAHKGQTGSKLHKIVDNGFKWGKWFRNVPIGSKGFIWEKHHLVCITS